MLKHLLVPLDETPLSEKALAYAIEVLAAGGMITLLRVVERAAVPNQRRDQVNNDILNRDMVGHARAYLEDRAANLRRDGIRTEIQVVRNDPVRAIVETAEAQKVSAIVIATNGRTGLARMVQGSITQKVLEAAPCPVLVVPVKSGQKVMQQRDPVTG